MSHTWKVYFLSCVLGTASLFTATPVVADWPQFLGPQRNGISSETGLLDTWPEGGPKEVWRVNGGPGLSGLAIAGGKLTTLVQHDDQQWVLCLEADTGRKLWETPFAAAYANGQGDGPRATPTMLDEQLYVYGGDGTLAALQIKDGKELWKVAVPKSLGGKPADYGMACSPLVVGNLVIVSAGVQGATLVAYDRLKGELAWKAKVGNDTAGYSAPILFNLAGKPQVAAFTGNSAVGISPDQGTVLWQFPYTTDYDCNVASPVVIGENLLISSGENHGSTLLKFTADGDKFQASPVWESVGSSSKLRSEWQTSILLDGHLYGLDNVGSAGPVTHLVCINATTGERVWQKARFGKSNLIAADGKLFLSTMKGELVVVRASPTKYEELGRSTVLQSTRQAPALAGGLLYLRDDQHIVCLNVKK